MSAQSLSILAAQRRQFLKASGALFCAASVGAYAQEPGAKRPGEKDLRVHQSAPHNAEPTLEKLVAKWTTPVEHFYVRSHGKVTPALDGAAYRLRIEGLVEKPLTLSIAELKEKFKPTEQDVTLTCAGNRRTEHSAIQQVSGVPWEAGAIGNARWQGPTLLSVLRAAGIKTEAKHVWFEGLDDVEHGDHPIKFGGSIPLEKVAAARDDAPTLLAYAMNGAALTADHGFPLRTIVPGYIGARSVKWLGKIVVSDKPSPNHFLAETYKLVKTSDKEEMAAAAPLYSNVLNAVIAAPAPQVEIAAGKLRVVGYALPSGKPGAKIDKVEVSSDGGKTWQRAKLDEDTAPYCWRLWSLELELAKGKHTLAARATDTSGASMPEKAEWNAKGYLYNGWHRVHVSVG